MNMHVGEVQDKKREAKLKVIIASIKRLFLALPRSQLTRVGVSFTRLRRINTKEIYRGLFLDKTQLATPLSLCKVFFLKKCMTGGGDSKCGAHALLTRLHNPSHDSRSGEVQPILVFQTCTETLSHIGELLTSTQMLPGDDCTACVSISPAHTMTQDSSNYLVCCFFILLFNLFSRISLLCCSKPLNGEIWLDYTGSVFC